MILVILLYALFALTFSATKKALLYGPPVFLTACRVFFGGLILLATYWTTQGFSLPRFSRREGWLFSNFAFFTHTISAFGITFMLLYISSVKAAFLYTFAPFFTAIIMSMLREEQLTFKKIMGLLIGFAGIIIIIFVPHAHASSDALRTTWMSPLLVDALAVSSVLSYSFGWVQAKRLVVYRNLPPILFNGLSMTCGGAVLMIASYLFEQGQSITDMKQFLIWTTVLCLSNNVLCYTLYVFLLKRYSATFISFAGFTEPIFAILYSLVLLNEGFNPLFLGAFAFIFAGLLMFYKEEIRLQRMP